MRLNKNLKSVLVILVFSFVIGTSSTNCYANDSMPTPTLVWTSNPGPTPVLRGNIKIQPDKVPITEQEYNPGDDLKDALKNGHVVGNHGLVKARPEPNPPTNLIIEPGNGMAYLTWDAMPRAESYLLYISEDGKDFKRRIKKPFHNHEVVVSVLDNDKTYYFGVVCVGSWGKETKMTIQTVVPRKDAVLSKKALTTPFN
jgi:hypothetical protein